MPSEMDVLAGRIGSSTRTQRINNMLELMDKAVSEVRENDKEKAMISVKYLASNLNLHRDTLYKNGYPNFFYENFESIKYKEQKGLLIEVEEYVEEREEQREKLSEINQKDEDET